MRVVLGLAVACLAGCASLEDTAVFYTPTSERFYPPLPKNEPVPVLSEPPEWPYEVIGRFALQSDQGYPRIYRAMLFNARRQGADAVILRRLAFDVRRTFNEIPATWRSVPQTNVWYQQVKNKKGEWVTVPQVYTTYLPLWQPARTVVTEREWTEVEAEMVVRRGRQPLAAPLPDQIVMPR